MALKRRDARRVVCASLALLLSGASLSAQTLPRLTMQGPAENAKTSPIRDSLGRPCLDVEAGARAQIVNPQMYDHVVSIKNNCVKLIKLKVCYLNSDTCNDLELQPYKRADTILGSMRGKNSFRYTIKLK